MDIDSSNITTLENALDPQVRERIDLAADRIVAAKQRGGKVVVVTGSGPNIHEGVTTLVAELMRQGIVDGVTTSSAVVSHEMGGVLDRVKRVDGRALGLPSRLLPRGHTFELTLADEDTLTRIREEMPFDDGLMDRLREMPGQTIIKAAGNLGYPVGLYIEWLAPQVAELAREHRLPFETLAGLGSDPRTLIGAGARLGLPVLVTIPQLVGGGAVGTAVGDSIGIGERAEGIARMLESADVIVESAVALTQEIHDGPFDTYTGHGLWAAWQGRHTFSLEGKTLVRIDLDPALEKVWQVERGAGTVQDAIDQGLPKTKLFEVPFRMEMSGFARLEGSIPIVGDIGAVWPVLAWKVSRRLNLELRFLSSPQHTEAGRAMREWIVEHIVPFDRGALREGIATTLAPTKAQRAETLM